MAKKSTVITLWDFALKEGEKATVLLKHDPRTSKNTQQFQHTVICGATI